MPLERVLVTGADGKIGVETVRHLRNSGAEVVAFARRFRHLTPEDARLVVGDARSEADIGAALLGVDSVVHLAALPHWTAGSPFEVYTTNVVSTFNVATQAAASGVRRVVIASSIQANGVLGNHHDVLPPYFPIDTDAPVHHDEWYSLSKYSDELTGRMVASHWGTSVVALRFPWTDDEGNLRDLAGAWKENPQEGVKLGWSYLDLRDAAEAVRCALTADIDGFVAVMLAASNTALADDTEKLLDEYAAHVPRKQRFPGRSVPVDIDVARRVLGFVPQHEIVGIVEPTEGSD